MRRLLCLLLLLTCKMLFCEKNQKQIVEDNFIREQLEEISPQMGLEKPKKPGGPLQTLFESKREINGYYICKSKLPGMTPEEVNESLRDTRKFIAYSVSTALQNCPEKIGKDFLTEILHIYGHYIIFIENAYVNRTTGRVFRPKENEIVRHADPLTDYWWLAGQEHGVKLHDAKFYASCLDYLIIMTRVYLLFPCETKDQWREMDWRWISWLERVAAKVRDDPIYGGYYQENVKLFREAYALWKQDYENKQKAKREARKWDAWED